MIDHVVGGRSHGLRVSVVLLVALAALASLAYASPPDPLWVAGIYDGADFDDVVSLVTNTETVDQSPQLVLAGLPPLVDSVLAIGILVASLATTFAFRPRSPPFA